MHVVLENRDRSSETVKEPRLPSAQLLRTKSSFSGADTAHYLRTSRGTYLLHDTTDLCSSGEKRANYTERSMLIAAFRFTTCPSPLHLGAGSCHAQSLPDLDISQCTESWTVFHGEIVVTAC
ncbi:hypothetical protein CERSUDRAFT_117093 [Gelatoporia subvermispora B]|uniref:Uncharacterized protein n=1 Tax=Ceriporiopsis subvermispora (strain B) TaxID=914234 RepID=M2PE99_CERS8|nr:hypothetical protein CERSUDRAFT_117093 [Gelatoporia subvermispora B]